MKVLELKKIKKSFGRVNAISDVSFHVNEGEVLGFLGDNGAGKSTTIRVISGVHAPDEGEIFFGEKKMDDWNVNIAHNIGIETVYQDRALAGQQSVNANIFMGREIKNRFGFIDVKKQRAETTRLINEIGFTSKLIREYSPVQTLSGGERQGVAIARALYFKAKLVLLDEPTTALSLTECAKVFRLIEHIKSEGLSCIFITHNIYHAHKICDRFVVMDRGTVAFECTRDEVTATELIDRMQNLAHTGVTERIMRGKK